MTTDLAIRLLDAFLQSLTPALGFQGLDRLIYTRRVNEECALLYFPCRPGRMGSGRFTCNVALRFPSLEPFLEESSNPLVPTVMMPLHLLREKQSYSPWEFHGAEELERLRHSIISDIVDLALPFIERYSRLTALQQRLESPSPRDWFILQPEGRLSILAVIRFVRGDKLDALRMLDDALLERKAAMPSKRLRLEAVRRRLAEAV